MDDSLDDECCQGKEQDGVRMGLLQGLPKGVTLDRKVGDDVGRGERVLHTSSPVGPCKRLVG